MVAHPLRALAEQEGYTDDVRLPFAWDVDVLRGDPGSVVEGSYRRIFVGVDLGGADLEVGHRILQDHMAVCAELLQGSVDTCHIAVHVETRLPDARWKDMLTMTCEQAEATGDGNLWAYSGEFHVPDPLGRN